MKRDWTDRLIDVAFSTLIFALAIGLVLILTHLFLASRAHAHEHQAGETTEQARIVDFYKGWKRPKGQFSITHRQGYCCYGDGARQDCFPVLARRVTTDGKEELMPDVSGAHPSAQTEYGNKWYPNNYHVAEDEQPDQRESPDGRSHMCIAGSNVICYVRGWGN